MTARDASSPLRLVAVGDIGRRAAYHVGDEAMLVGLIETATRGAVPVEWTVMSADPARTAATLGVRAIPRLTFDDCAGPDEREARLTALDQVAVEAIADCDGVVIAGGGNLSRSWPAEVFERAAVARAAQRAGRPVALTSQTIGPSFDDRTRELTAALLTRAVFVGLREASSYELAIELGAPRDRTVLQFDDGAGVRPSEPPWWRGVAGDGPFIAVTLNPLGHPLLGEDVAVRLARELVAISRATGATIVMTPHVGDLDGAATHDVAISRAVADASDSLVKVTPLPTPEQAVWIAARAELVVSTRYHPIVFAMAEATPSLFLHQDHYTFVKGAGALSLAGLSSWTLPVADAAAGLLTPAALELWARRRELREHLRRAAPTTDARRQQHVADLLSALTSRSGWSAAAPTPAPSGPVARGEWVSQAHGGAAVLQAADARVREIERLLIDAGQSVRALTREVERKETELVVAQTALAELTASARASHAALESALVAAQTALADLTRTTRESHDAWAADRNALVRHGEALERDRASLQRQCELVEQRASTAEQWAGVQAREVERKDTELKIAIAALEEAERQRARARSAPPVEEPEGLAGPPRQS